MSSGLEGLVEPVRARDFDAPAGLAVQVDGRGVREVAARLDAMHGARGLDDTLQAWAHRLRDRGPGAVICARPVVAARATPAGLGALDLRMVGAAAIESALCAAVLA